MSAPGGKAGWAATARYPWAHLTTDLADWPVSPSYADAKGRERTRMRTTAVTFARDLIAHQCPRELAVTFAACKYLATEASVTRWMAALEGAPPGTAEVPIRPQGRPARIWKARGAEAAYHQYRTIYAEHPNSAAAWRTVEALAAKQGWTIPCEASFRHRMQQEAGARQAP